MVAIFSPVVGNLTYGLVIPIQYYKMSFFNSMDTIGKKYATYFIIFEHGVSPYDIASLGNSRQG
jgi:hypothetical protein